jgi:hypothetical protein
MRELRFAVTIEHYGKIKKSLTSYDLEGRACVVLHAAERKRE